MDIFYRQETSDFEIQNHTSSCLDGYVTKVRTEMSVELHEDGKVIVRLTMRTIYPCGDEASEKEIVREFTPQLSLGLPNRVIK